MGRFTQSIPKKTHQSGGRQFKAPFRGLDAELSDADIKKLRSQWTANHESLFREELNETIDQDTLDNIDSPGKLRKALLAARYDGAEIYATGVNSMAGNLQLNSRFICCDSETGKSSMGGKQPHMMIPLDEQDKYCQKHHNWSFIDQKFEAKKQAMFLAQSGENKSKGKVKFCEHLISPDLFHALVMETRKNANFNGGCNAAVVWAPNRDELLKKATDILRECSVPHLPPSKDIKNAGEKNHLKILIPAHLLANYEGKIIDPIEIHDDEDLSSNSRRPKGEERN